MTALGGQAGRLLQVRAHHLLLVQAHHLLLHSGFHLPRGLLRLLHPAPQAQFSALPHLLAPVSALPDHLVLLGLVGLQVVPLGLGAQAHGLGKTRYLAEFGQISF
ncbi:hypothetical protein CRG98_037782 [Punica granatum]|uniref:Uncharacterized protein n=1 Tax=Punica granatum TaxID=22663 RepID=A0A2I0ICU7_PUNGR|nr:hypothetical protein CRG98_037782 [Punica granatum]